MFVDESGTHISMDRLRSRAPKGERAYGKVPKNRGKNLTLIASMSLYGMGEAMCVEGAHSRKGVGTATSSGEQGCSGRTRARSPQEIFTR